MNSRISRFILALVICAFSLAANAGNVDDDLRQAAKLHKGGETNQAISLWKQWADKGNADAAYNLAVIHQYGDGVTLDYGKAMQWYRVAADQGDKISQLQIGLMYSDQVLAELKQRAGMGAEKPTATAALVSDTLIR